MNDTSRTQDDGMAPAVYLDCGNVRVTDRLCSIGGDAHALEGVISASVSEARPNPVLSFMFLQLGVLLLVVSDPMIGIAVMTGAASYLYRNRIIFHLNLVSAESETAVLESTKRPYVERIARAVNSAIARRN